MINVTITGTAETIGALRDIESEIESIAEDQAEKVSKRAFNSVRKGLTQSIAGFNDFVGPIPTNGEEPPHARTGRLAVSVYREKAGPHSYRIGTPLDYGKMLEYGTRNMKRRPWLVKTVMKYRKQFYSGMNARIKQAVTKMGVQRAKVRFK